MENHVLMFRKNLERLFQSLLLLFVGAYRTIGTNQLGGCCRFQPSCSEYALEALRTHSPQTAVKLIAGRIVRCRPGGAYGFDPVPQPVPKPVLQLVFKEIRR